MDIEEYKIKYGYKELPWHFYLRGALFWCWPMILVVGFLAYFRIIDVWIGFIIYVIWAIFWCMKAIRKMNKNKLRIQGEI